MHALCMTLEVDPVLQHNGTTAGVGTWNRTLPLTEPWTTASDMLAHIRGCVELVLTRFAVKVDIPPAGRNVKEPR